MRLLHRFVFVLAAFLSLALVCLAQAPAPEYELRGNRLQHKSAGGYVIEVANDLKYVGVERFHIRTAADAELHLFADADSSGKVRRLVWVQVESQLPGQDWQYNYPSPDRTKLGDLEFITDAAAFRAYHADDPTSDHAVVDRLLQKKGLDFAGPVLRVRMIYLPDAERRRELMVIYAEALPGQYTQKIEADGSEGTKFPEELRKLKAMAERDVKARLAR